MSDSPQRKTLEEINSQYREQVPEDLRGSHSFDWYLDEVYESPEVTRNAHQRVADMFEYFGTEYDEETGIVEYKLATEDPLHDGENTFFGEIRGDHVFDVTGDEGDIDTGVGDRFGVATEFGLLGFDRLIELIDAGDVVLGVDLGLADLEI